LFWDNNHYVLTFVDPATANQARAEVDRQVVADHVLAADAQAKAEIRGGVRWTFAELDEWYRYIIPQIHGPGSGISSTDIDEFANTIAFGVIDEASRAKLETQLASLGVSCNLVTTVIQPYAVLAKG